MHSRTPSIFSALALAVALQHSAQAWSPGTSDPDAIEGFAVTASDRLDVLSFYNTVYNASEDFAANMVWTGNVDTGVAGTTSAVFKDDVRRRINFFRALCGLPADIRFDATRSAKDQAAALMFAANSALSHTPPTSWTWYTAEGAEAAGKSNIALGNYGPDAIDAYIRDDGSNNTIVGHRRWLLYSRAQFMGTGDIPPTSGRYSANACWVIGDFKSAAASAFVAWPNHGYCPFDLLPARWSLSYPGANFASATVTLSQNGTNIPVSIISRTNNGYGDNTIVWEPQTLPASISDDIPFTVTVAGIAGTGVPTSHTYNVTLFDPGRLGLSVTIAGPDSPPTTGAAYTFGAIPHADAYQLRVSTSNTDAWAEGAEDDTASLVEAATTGSYPLRHSAYKRSGAKAFHLAFPDFEDQGFVILRDIIPSPTSALQFHDRGFFATTTTTLSAEISTDNGNTWTSLWSRPGVGLNSSDWDSGFRARSVSLADFANQLVRVRFALRWNQASTVINTSDTCGFYIDDVSVTNATQLVGTTVTALDGTASGFTLDASTAGAALLEGASYVLRIRPQVGTRWFGDGQTKTITVVPPGGYRSWAAAQSPVVTGGPLDDDDGDGLCNGIEYAFGLDPIHASTTSELPQATHSGNALSVAFAPIGGATGVVYGAEYSTDLVTWIPIADTGDSSTHIFSVNTTGFDRCFIRHVVTVVP